MAPPLYCSLPCSVIAKKGLNFLLLKKLSTFNRVCFSVLMLVTSSSAFITKQASPPKNSNQGFLKDFDSENLQKSAPAKK